MTTHIAARVASEVVGKHTQHIYVWSCAGHIHLSIIVHGSCRHVSRDFDRSCARRVDARENERGAQERNHPNPEYGATSGVSVSRVRFLIIHGVCIGEVFDRNGHRPSLFLFLALWSRMSHLCQSDNLLAFISS